MTDAGTCCTPASTGVPASIAAAFSAIGIGVAPPPSITEVTFPSERPAAAASVSALSRASSIAAFSALR